MKKILLITTVLSILVSPSQTYSLQNNPSYFSSDFSRPFVIDGEGTVPNFIGLEPLPDGRLLAVTPLSYRILDPDTGKFSGLPQGFPEGEITQWEQDFAVVRTRTGSDPHTNYVYTIWPGNRRFLAQTESVCFLDKDGSHLLFMYEQKSRKLFLGYFDNQAKIIWKSECSLFSTDYSPIRFFGDKIAVINSEDYSSVIGISIHDRSDGHLVTSGFSYGKNERYLKPKEIGGKYYYAGSEVFPSIIKHEDRGTKTFVGDGFFETADFDGRTNLVKYKKMNAEKETIYACEFNVQLQYPDGNKYANLLGVANGIVYVQNRHGDCYLFDVENTRKSMFIPDCIGYRTDFFNTDRHIVFRSQTILSIVSLAKKEISQRIPWPSNTYIQGSGVVSWPFALEGEGAVNKAMSTQQPKNTVLLQDGFALETHKDGIIAYKQSSMKGETNAYLYGFDGNITSLGKASNEMSIKWCGYWNGNVYAVATLTWFPERQSAGYLFRAEKGEWKIEFELPEILTGRAYAFFRDGRIMLFENSVIFIIELDKQIIFRIKPPDEIKGAHNYYKLLSDCFIQSFVIKDGKKLMVYYFADGKYVFYDDLVWAGYDRICLTNNDEFYILSKGVLTKIPPIKIPNQHQTQRTMGDCFLSTDYTHMRENQTNRDCITSIFDAENNLVQKIPIYSQMALSLPKELYPAFSYTNYTAPPADGFLPVSKKCASYKIERTGEFTFDFMAKNGDFSGNLWFVKHSAENLLVPFANPTPVNLKNDGKIQLDFSKEWDEKADYQGFVVVGNGFFETDSIGIYNRTKLYLPIFGGMQTGPSGKEIVCSIVWDNKEK